MLIAILFALELHLIWIHRSYRHQSNPLITVRVQAGCKLISLILTATIFTMVAAKLEQWHLATYKAEAPAGADSTAVEANNIAQLVSALGGAENYLRYLELRNGK